MPHPASLSPTIVPGHALWARALTELGTRVSSKQSSDLAHHINLLRATARELTVAIPQGPLQHWRRDGSIRILAAVLAELTQHSCEFSVIPSAGPDPSNPSDLSALSGFILGPRNQEAHDLARAVISRPGLRASPLLIHGPVGSGKTHLLRTITGELRQRLPGRPVLSLEAGELSEQLITAIRSNEFHEVHSRLQGCAALLIDDVELLKGREASERELTQTLDSLAQAHSQVVLTTACPRGEVPDLGTALQSQLHSATHLHLQPLEWETRVAIVLERLGQWGLEPHTDPASLIVSALGDSLHRLDTLLTMLLTHPDCASDVIPSHTLRPLLARISRPGEQVSPDALLNAVTRHFHVRLADLRSPSRSPHVTTPRQIAMYLLRHHCQLSYPEIGRRLRRRHTTALHACRRIQELRAQKPDVDATLSMLEKDLRQSAKLGG